MASLSVSRLWKIPLFLLSISFATLHLGLHSSQAANETGKSIPLKVIIDRAKVVRIAKPADTIIVGNPSIMDASIQDASTLILTGRSFGVTNLIVLDSNGDPIVDETVVVQGHDTNTVRIYRRSERETLACSPVCEPTLTIGDSSGQFESNFEQISRRNGLSTAAAAP